MVAEEPLATDTPQPETQDKRPYGWLPWLVLLVVLLIIAWLLFKYADFGTTPTLKPVATSERVAVVPDVVGFDRRAAVRELEDAGFLVTQEVSFDALAEPGTVATQEPMGGARVLVGSEVVIGVTADLGAVETTGTEQDFGPRAPDVVGLSEAGARDLLERGGYGIAVSYSYSDNQPQGVVYAQSPSAGDPAESGMTISVWVSKGAKSAPKVAVPSLVGLTESAATKRIKAAGLTPRPMRQPMAESVGVVYQQQPPAGEKVVPGRYVFILVGVQP